MARKGVRAMILCEDEDHHRFARRVLLKLGYHYGEFRKPRIAPRVRGSAAAWVSGQYPSEVRLHQQRAASQKVGLLVVIDADRQTVQERHGQLSEALVGAEVKARGNEERIAIWVPRRHIETWVAYLTERNVTEDDDCKRQHLVSDQDYKPAAERFVVLYREPLSRPDDMLGSLSRAFDETQRLEAS